MPSFSRTYDADLRSFAVELLRYESTSGREKPVQRRVREELDRLGFETVEWEANAERLAEHPSFPDDPADVDAADRPSVAGVLEFGDPDAGPTLVLNGHTDVVPADEAAWDTDPFEPTWDGDALTARGAADMKTNLALLVYVARFLHDEHGDDLDGRLVVESVTGEEEGGIGAPAAALDSPYPFERDAALVAEPTDLRVVTATEGVLMKRLALAGRSAHAATRWRGESVLPHFESVRRALEELERERHERVTHPLYDHPVNWPVNVGVVRAGEWASSVPSSLTAQVRIGFSPDESLAEVEAEFDGRVRAVAEGSEWLSEHPPGFERRAIHFEPAEVDADEPVVGVLRGAMADRGLADTEPVGATYSSDSRFYIERGIPTVLFGPGTIDQAHFPGETVEWPDVLTAADVLVETCRRYLAGA